MRRLKDNVCLRDGEWVWKGTLEPEVPTHLVGLIGDHLWVQDDGSGMTSPPPGPAAPAEPDPGDLVPRGGQVDPGAPPPQVGETDGPKLAPAPILDEDGEAAVVQEPEANDETVADFSAPDPDLLASAPVGSAPPKSGRGSSAAAWAEYAAANGVTLPEDAGRDDIIAELEKRKIATGPHGSTE